jgi:hypothetical protein
LSIFSAVLPVGRDLSRIGLGRRLPSATPSKRRELTAPRRRPEGAGGKIGDFLAKDGLWKGNRVIAGSKSLYPAMELLFDVPE